MVFHLISGNILFIPEIRWLFHRNDLIVAHAHVAMGIAVFFMVISMFINHIKELHKKIFLKLYLVEIDIAVNILFIPEIRWLFHRNDLIVAPLS